MRTQVGKNGKGIVTHGILDLPNFDLKLIFNDKWSLRRSKGSQGTRKWETPYGVKAFQSPKARSPMAGGLHTCSLRAPGACTQHSSQEGAVAEVGFEMVSRGANRHFRVCGWMLSAP